MIIKSILFFCFIFLSTFVFSQSFDLVGNVVIENVDESIPLNQIVIINKNTEKRVNANEKGGFRIQVNLNDELILRSAITAPRTIKISQNILSKGFINVHLDLETIELSEANINPLKGELKDNLNLKETDLDILKRNIGYDSKEFKEQLKKQQEYTQTRKVISETGGVNLLGIGKSLFGKKDKPYKNPQKLNFQVAEEIKEYFTVNYFLNDLKIPENQINTFIGYCMNNSNLRKLFESQLISEMVVRFEQFAQNFLKIIATKPS